MALTRLSLDGYGAKRVGSFAAKTPAPVVPEGGVLRMRNFGHRLASMLLLVLLSPAAGAGSAHAFLLDLDPWLSAFLILALTNLIAIVIGVIAIIAQAPPAEPATTQPLSRSEAVQQLLLRRLALAREARDADKIERYSRELRARGWPVPEE